MSKNSLPVIPTILVLSAAATMVALGFWQLDRLDQKETLLAQYDAALARRDAVNWPQRGDDRSTLFRRSSVDCVTVERIDSIAGTSREGRAGWAHIARCRLKSGQSAFVAIGWSREPKLPQWQGGRVDGWIAPYKKGIRLVADDPQAGLAPLARPDPSSIPNNHFAYAVQWFLFALTALIIYVLALRGRLRRSG